eukprot:TRINITY_DN2227_c0_g1_i4.p1 TRINITY_DN2227_c0_g1~~TRINITY_DN2227_c0_g1_i4.p1  ORF type:complete len:376 (-),score=62.15 TRINITY_DN2227_c0_g1_i4:91-1086(-)
MAAATPAGVVEREPALPQTTIDTGHADMIHDSQLDYYGLRLATASSDRTVRIFSPTGGSPPQHTLSAELVGHDGPVWQVSWAHPSFGGLLASAGFDGRVILWKEDVATGTWRRAYEYSWHASSVNSVAFAPSAYGLAFACASSDGFVSIVSHNPADGTWTDVRVSDAADGARKRTPSAPPPCRLHPQRLGPRRTRRCAAPPPHRDGRLRRARQGVEPHRRRRVGARRPPADCPPGVGAVGRVGARHWRRPRRGGVGGAGQAGGGVDARRQWGVVGQEGAARLWGARLERVVDARGGGAGGGVGRQQRDHVEGGGEAGGRVLNRLDEPEAKQ